MRLLETLVPNAFVNLLLEADALRPLLSVLPLAFTDRVPFTPNDSLLGMVPGQGVGFFAQGLDLLGKQPSFLACDVSLFPESVTVIQRGTELIQSRAVVIDRTGQRILSVKDTGGEILRVEFLGLAGDQPVDLIFSLVMV
ncbi:hypothetical protein [Pseudomonas fluorescens]|uniref:hypothetical protein n=1 Tax=Pseudomonas fluorescens TaxID=294 RepID=UPI0011D1E7FE|nr:hypothetical protein [Pseudomonas fluorescens]